jgi:hypothetical protein
VLLDDVMLEDAVAALDTAASPARPPEPAEASNR